MWPFFYFPKKAPTPSPSAPQTQEFEGTLPDKYDHIVRVTFEVDPDQEPNLRLLLKSISWPFLKLDPQPGDPDMRDIRYIIQIPITGASSGSTGKAVSLLREHCRRAGVRITLMSTARPRPREAPSRQYHVVSVVPDTDHRVEKLYQRVMLRALSQGTIRARSLTEAEARLPGYIANHPGVGELDELTVIGRLGRVDASRQSPLPSRGELLLIATMIITVVLVLTLMLTALLPEGGTPGEGIFLLTTALCLFGVWLLLRLLRESQMNSWFLGVATSSIPILVAGMGYLDIYTYMWQFDIAPGDIDIPVYHQALASMNSIAPIAGASIIAAGIFGFLQHFHLGGYGHLRFLNWLFASLIMFTYVGTTTHFLIERTSTMGALDAIRYQTVGGPISDHAGITPTPVCIEDAAEPKARFGPELPTERPVLHFQGMNGTDLLWNGGEGITKVPGFSVTLTPVNDLDRSCPAPSPTEESTDL